MKYIIILFFLLASCQEKTRTVESINVPKEQKHTIKISISNCDSFDGSRDIVFDFFHKNSGVSPDRSIDATKRFLKHKGCELITFFEKEHGIQREPYEFDLYVEYYNDDKTEPIPLPESSVRKYADFTTKMHKLIRDTLSQVISIPEGDGINIRNYTKERYQEVVKEKILVLFHGKTREVLKGEIYVSSNNNSLGQIKYEDTRKNFVGSCNLSLKGKYGDNGFEFQEWSQKPIRIDLSQSPRDIYDTIVFELIHFYTNQYGVSHLIKDLDDLIKDANGKTITTNRTIKESTNFSEIVVHYLGICLIQDLMKKGQYPNNDYVDYVKNHESANYEGLDDLLEDRDTSLSDGLYLYDLYVNNYEKFKRIAD